MMVSWNIDSFTETIYLTCDVFSITIKLSLNYFFDSIYWSVFISSSLSGSFWSEFILVSLTFPRCHQRSSNQGQQKFQASVYSKVHFRGVVTKFSFLDVSGLASGDKHNRQSRRFIRRVFVIFTFRANNQVIRFLKVTSDISFKPLYCIYFLPVLSIFLAS